MPEKRPRRRALALQVIDTVPGPRAWCGCETCWPAYIESVWRWSKEDDPHLVEVTDDDTSLEWRAI